MRSPLGALRAPLDLAAKPLRDGSPGPRGPELVWPGKYDERGDRVRAPRVCLPLEPLEVVGGDGRVAEASRLAEANLLVAGDNVRAMDALLSRFEGRVDLIYIDPPFATGTDFAFDARVGDERLARGRAGLAYADAWAAGDYLSAMTDRLERMRALLADTGTIFVHCDWHVGHQLRCVLDEVFGADCFKNEIVWRYRRWPAKTRVFQRMHDVLFWYGKRPGDRHTWNPSYEPLAPSTLASFGTRRQVADFSTGRRRPSQTDEESPGAPMSDVWDIGIVAPIARERVGYPTQKPEQLVGRIVEATTKPGDLVADFFCGSGTTLAVAEKLGRRWVGCDLGAVALQTTKKRLVAARREDPSLPPFVMVGLGREPRDAGRAANAAGADRDPSRRRRALEVFGAVPLASGSAFGVVGRDLVVVAGEGSRELEDAAAHAKRLGLARLVVLASSFDADAYARAEASALGLDVRLVRLPRELFDSRARPSTLGLVEVPRVTAVLERAEGDGAVVRVKDVALAEDACVPAAIRAHMKKPLDLVDGLAIDSDHDGRVFVHRWSSYRSRTKRALELVSPAFSWTPRARVLLRVVDVFGHATDVTPSLPSAHEPRAARGPGLRRRRR